jgi:ATP-binding cassette subfamily B protein
MSGHPRHTTAPSANRNDWSNIRSLMPYLWEYRGRVLLALSCLVLAKVANVGVPLMLKELVDYLEVDPKTSILIVLPVALLLSYGALKISSSLFNELRDVLFTRVRYRAMRRLTLKTLSHLHDLALRFHLERKMGAISQDLARGAASLSTLLNYLTFSILPILVEFTLVAGILITQYDQVFSLIIFGSVVVYVAFTFAVSNWRMEYRLAMNRYQSQANNEAIESLINYETVKYFGNETLELNRCDNTLGKWEQNAVLSQASMSALNFGQAAIIAVGVMLIMFFAADEVISGEMGIGDFVLVNAFLIQIFIPLGFLGIVYRQMKHSLTDMDQLVKLLDEVPEIKDEHDAKPLIVDQGEVKFDHVEFSYQTDRPILHDVSFTIKPGKKVAVVGASGAGKTTLARLLFRFYDVSGGKIFIDGQDISNV